MRCRVCRGGGGVIVVLVRALQMRRGRSARRCCCCCLSSSSMSVVTKPPLLSQKNLCSFVYAESKSKTPQRRGIDEEATYLQGSDGKYRDGHETAWRADIWAFRVASWVATHVWTLSIVLPGLGRAGLASRMFVRNRIGVSPSAY